MLQHVKSFIFKLLNYILFRDENSNYWWHLRKIALNSKGILRIWAKINYRKITSKHNSFVPLSCKFANKPILPHGLCGLFISNGAQIGSNCVIFQQVTIDSNNLIDAKKKGSPIIGDNCYIGCGAKIIGAIKVGNNVRIGANCIVVENIPDNCTVVMNKPQIIKKRTIQNNRFISFKENNF